MRIHVYIHIGSQIFQNGQSSVSSYGILLYCTGDRWRMHILGLGSICRRHGRNVEASWCSKGVGKIRRKAWESSFLPRLREAAISFSSWGEGKAYSKTFSGLFSCCSWHFRVASLLYADLNLVISIRYRLLNTLLNCGFSTHCYLLQNLGFLMKNNCSSFHIVSNQVNSIKSFVAVVRGFISSVFSMLSTTPFVFVAQKFTAN